MADAPAAAPAAAPSTPSPVAAPAVAPEAPTGIAKMASEFNKLTTPAAKPAEPAKEPAKPAEPVGKEKVAPAKPDEADVDWEKAPPKLKGAFFKTRREFEGKISTLEKQIAEINAKPKEAPTDVKLVEKYQGEIKALQDRLTAQDYRNSGEFQKNFVGKWRSEYDTAAAEVATLKVITGKDADTGNNITRAATKADFDKILRLPAAEQDEAIYSMFGASAGRIAARVLELNRIERASEQAVADHTKNAEAKAAEVAAMTTKEKAAYDKAMADSQAEIEKTWPEIFGDDGKDPEITAAITYGKDYVQNVLTQVASLPPEERAAHNAVLQSRAAHFPRVVLDNKRLKSENESLKTELKKYRKSDPGDTEGKTPAAEPAGDEPYKEGIKGMSKAFVGTGG